MAKVPINHCSYEDLVAIPGATPAELGCLLGLRAQYGEVTPELFEASPLYVEVKDLQGSLDFRPKGAAGESPIRQGRFRTLSETGDFCSTPAEAPRGARDKGLGAPAYPHNRYPPWEISPQ